MTEQTLPQNEMSEAGRLAGIFWEPKPVFESLDARPRFWVPLILTSVLAVLYIAAFSRVVGWESMLRRQLSALDDAALFVRAGADSRTFEFPHDLVRQVAYESMLESTRVRLHAGMSMRLEFGMWPWPHRGHSESVPQPMRAPTTPRELAASC